MDTPSVSKTLKQIDPVWKQLRFGRVYTLIYLIVILFSFYEGIMDHSWQRQGIGFIYGNLFIVVVLLSSIADQFRNERYWKRIGQRRLEAIHDAQPFLDSNQPPHDNSALTLPVMLRLHWHRGIVVAIGEASKKVRDFLC